MTTIDLRNGDCIEQMRQLKPNSVDSIVTDPPYELGFMGKSWDSTGIAYSVKMWDEALRVLKPGGHLLAFSGSRTYHRMVVAIEDAGFEIRDQIMWVYGSGFPKSLDVSKAIDKHAGVEREVLSTIPDRWAGKGNVLQRSTQEPAESVNLTEATTDKAKQWAGWGTALKPAHEPIVLARKPLIGTVATNVIIHGTGALNIDGSRIGTIVETWPASRNYSSKEMSRPGSTSANDAVTQSTGDAPQGRWPANFIHDGSDEVVELFPDTGKSTGGRIGKKSMGEVTNVPAGQYEAGDPGYGDSGSAARFFYCAKASKKDRNEGLDGFEEVRESDRIKDDGVGGDNPRNRSNNARANHHPTVKPTELMRYLVRLVTIPNGTVLDPFMGSGSTGKAAVLEHFSFIGIDQSADYLEIATARIKHAQELIESQLL
jgi:site-specific DNA-methyltransferase (adenine-specific)